SPEVEAPARAQLLLEQFDAVLLRELAGERAHLRRRAPELEPHAVDGRRLCRAGGAADEEGDRGERDLHPGLGSATSAARASTNEKAFLPTASSGMVTR